MPLHCTQLAELVADYRHIVLSPHLDDAALSCGGLIIALASSGSPALVVNVCSGSPGPEASYSAFAETLHTRWGFAAAEAMHQRLAEDELALETLGADSYQLDLLDAIYRLPEAYASETALFGPMAPEDTLTDTLVEHLEALVARFPGTVFYAPLGVGSHVDHQAVYSAAASFPRRGTAVIFYEDFPYVVQAGALEQRFNALGGRHLFMPFTINIEAHLARKIAAIEAYRSQLSSLFADSVAMAAAVRGYAERIQPAGRACGERLWVPQ